MIINCHIGGNTIKVAPALSLCKYENLISQKGISNAGICQWKVVIFIERFVLQPPQIPQVRDERARKNGPDEISCLLSPVLFPQCSSLPDQRPFCLQTLQSLGFNVIIKYNKSPYSSWFSGDHWASRQLFNKSIKW